MNRSIWLLSIAAFLAAAITRMTDSLLPEIATDFDVSINAATIAITAFTLAYGSFQLVYGGIGARIGPYRTATIAAGLAAIGATASALATDLLALAGARLLSGMAVAAVIPMSMAYIGETVAYEERQPVIARFLTGQVLGVIAGQAFAGLFAELLSWRQLFWLLAIGFAAIGFALGCELRSGRVPTYQPRATSISPLHAYIRVLRVPWARVILACVVIEGFLLFGAFPFLAPHLADAFGRSALTIGLVVSGFGVGGMIYIVAVRRLHHRLGETGLAICGGALLCLGLVTMAVSPGWQLLVPATLIAGLGFYMLHNTLQTNATQMTPFDRSSAIALFAFGLFVSQAIGVWFFGQLAGSIGYRPVFAIAGVGLVLLAIAFARRRALHVPAP